MDTALVLVSGGLDSAVALYWAQRRGWEVTPLTIHFHNRPPREVRATRDLVEAAGCPHPLIEVDLPFLAEAEDLVAEGRAGDHLKRAPPSYAPARNLVFYSVAAHYGEALGVRWIVGGHNGTDGDTFPDATPRFFQDLNRLLEEGLLTYGGVGLQIVNPLQGLTKAEVIRQGLEFGAPLERTWSCHRDREVPCGACASCRERAEAFREADLQDPLVAKVRERG